MMWAPLPMRQLRPITDASTCSRRTPIQHDVCCPLHGSLSRPKLCLLCLQDAKVYI